MSFIGKISAALSSIAFALLTACSSGSSDPTAVAGDFSAYGVKGTVSGQNVTLDLSGLGNCATTVENMVIGVNANGASISPDPRIARDYSQPVQFTLTAPDGTNVVYTVTIKGAACVTTPPPPPPSTPDTTPPVITVLGTNPLSLTIGTVYTEAGATCVDNKDPSCTVVTSGTVNTAVVGAYTITYTATDAAGNVSSKIRIVNVASAPAPVLTVPTYKVYDDDGGTGISNIGQIVVTDSLSRPVTFGAATATRVSGSGTDIPTLAIVSNGNVQVTSIVNNVDGGAIATIYKVDFTYTVGGITYSGSFTFGVNDNA